MIARIVYALDSEFAQRAVSAFYTGGMR